jgi:hypothetical protein
MRSPRASIEERFAQGKTSSNLNPPDEAELLKVRRAAQQGRRAVLYWGLRWTAIMVISSNWGASLI